ncbi:hypothetical protein ID867_17315 [Streptomyces parvulus]|nr:hypothetical protein [Streptomyces parvulus]
MARAVGLRMAEDVVEAVHTPLPGVRVEVRRCVDGAVLRERYTVVNRADESLAVTGLGIQTPFADWYRDARTSLEEAVHAHVFTGGTWAWVLAQPMSGEGRCLGLIVREGAVRAYSVESRNQASLSDVRGHLVLQVTDHVRNPDAFGGQPVLRLAPGESVSLAWELDWYESVGAFTAATRPPAAFSAYAAETGTPIIVEAASVSSPDPQVKVEREAEGQYRVEAFAHGTRTLDIGDGARTEVLFHLPLEEVVRRRVAYIACHQRAVERPGLLAHAFVSVNTRTGLTGATNGWPDWSDGSERIAMPLLLQAATSAASQTLRRPVPCWMAGPASPYATSSTRPTPRAAARRPGTSNRGCTTCPGWPASSSTGTGRTAGKRTWSAPPASSSAASTWAAPPICPSTTPDDDGRLRRPRHRRPERPRRTAA